MPVPVYDASPTTFDHLVLEPRGELVVVDFWGDGCPNCDVFHQEKQSLLAELEGSPLRLVRVDAYTHDELARRHGVFGIPAFFLFRDGKLLGRMSEYRGREFWLTVVREHLPG